MYISLYLRFYRLKILTFSHFLRNVSYNLLINGCNIDGRERNIKKKKTSLVRYILKKKKKYTSIFK